MKESENITVVIPPAMFPMDKPVSQLLEAGLRIIADACGGDSDWCEKYGANFENSIFRMHVYCWCEEDACPYCREIDPEPNFWHKASGLKVTWYKYIGRGMEIEGVEKPEWICNIITECLKSIERGVK